VILEQLILPSYTAGIVSGVATSVLVAVRDGGQVNVMNLEEFVEVVLGGRYATSTL
jgi:ribose 5-phosphate isomerase A